MVIGNVEGVKKYILSKLDDLHNVRFEKTEIISNEVIDILVNVTKEIEREVSIAIDRKGKVVSVAIGDSSSVDLPIIDTKEGRLSGVRVIHTHPNGNPNLSALDLSALLKLKLDAIVALGVSDKYPIKACIGFCGVMNNVLVDEETLPLDIEDLLSYNFMNKVINIESIMGETLIEEDNSERAILVGTEDEDSLNELEELTKACNVNPVYSILQKRNKIDAAFYIGKGKVEEIAHLRQELRANVIIFDEELSGSQVRNLEEAIGVKVIDRTTLILEIFATRAKTKEAKIQVELSQLKYRLSRLSGLGTVLSRTGGGIGTRGPGEKKLETDKRHIRERLYELTRELEKIKSNRAIQRAGRVKDSVSTISIAGYTNAGKSTLRNSLCEYAPQKSSLIKEKVFEADMLFATLDTTTRGIVLPDNREATLTDTVGFIRKLPHDLVQAFKSTLEEVVNADLILHVVDSSSSSAIKQVEVVEEVLRELGTEDKPVILVLNKIDKANAQNIIDIKERFFDHNIVEVSAVNQLNFDKLLSKAMELLPYKVKSFKAIIPYSDTAMVSYIHRNGKVISEDYVENGTLINGEGNEEVYNKCSKYIVKEE